MKSKGNISKLAHFISPQLGKLYDSYSVFFNDGIVGFIIGIPISFILYQPVAPHLHFHFLVDLSWLVQLIWYIVCAFISFCIQHVLRRRWVFKPKNGVIRK